MLRRFARALDTTHKFLHAMGAKVAPAKSFNFASTSSACRWLAATWWDRISSCIAVVKDFRYLGVHLSTQLQRRYDTLERRLGKALGQLHRLRFVAAAASSKAKTVRTKIIPGLLYGIEVNDFNDTQLRRLAAAIVDVFSCRNDNHDTEWFFLVHSRGLDLDPLGHVLLRRCLEVRRSIGKRPASEQKMKHIMSMYVEQARATGKEYRWYRQAELEEEPRREDYPEPVPHPSRKPSGSWRQCISPKGPVGLFIQSVLRSGMQVSEDLVLWQHKEQPLDLLQTPYQYLGKLVMQSAVRSRSAASCGTRHFKVAVKEVDMGVTTRASKGLPDEDARSLSRSAAFGKSACDGVGARMHDCETR